MQLTFTTSLKDIGNCCAIFSHHLTKSLCFGDVMLLVAIKMFLHLEFWFIVVGLRLNHFFSGVA